MKTYSLPLSCFLLILAAAITLACGSRMLKSVSLSPPSANASGNPVQFTATGYYNMGPMTVTPLEALWGVCYQGNFTSAVSVSQNGLAQCGAGSVGTYTVWADAPSGSTGPCSQHISACGVADCQITGAAQLTCP